MNENPYSTPPVAEEPHVVQPPLAPESREINPALLIPSLRFITILFILHAVSACLYTLFALFTLRSALPISDDSIARAYQLYYALNALFGFVNSVLAVYVAVCIWQYRVKLDLFLAGEATNVLFAQAHLNRWRSFTIGSVVGLTFYLANWAASIGIEYMVTTMT